MARIPLQIPANTPPHHVGGGRFHRHGGRTCPKCGGLIKPMGHRDPWHAYHPRCRPQDLRGFVSFRGMVMGGYETESIAGEIVL